MCLRIKKRLFQRMQGSFLSSGLHGMRMTARGISNYGSRIQGLKIGRELPPQCPSSLWDAHMTLSYEGQVLPHLA